MATNIPYVEISIIPYVAGSSFSQNKMWKKAEKWQKPWHMGTHMRVLSQSYLMNINMAGIRWLSNILVGLGLL